MDQLALMGLEILKTAPTAITFLFATIAMIVAIYVYVKRVNIAEYTSVGNLQNKQTKLLMDQIEQLSKDLQEARKELRELFDQNLVLMRRINELESFLSDNDDDNKPKP